MKVNAAGTRAKGLIEPLANCSSSLKKLLAKQKSDLNI